jgi:hypothetical protein
MSEEKVSVAAKIAASHKQSQEQKAFDAQAASAAADPSTDSGITVGATTGGASINNPQRPAGSMTHVRAPGYYSRHCGIVRLKRRSIPWPMEAPLIPLADDEELLAVLESLVERNLAELVLAEIEE